MFETVPEQIEAIKEELKSLDQKMQRTIIKKGLRVGARMIARSAKAQAPTRSGELRRSIKVTAGRSGNGVARINIGMSAKDYTGKAFYAAFLLYGHRLGKRELGDSRKLIHGHNFLESAFEGSKDAALQACVDSWKSQIDNALSK